MEKKKTIKTGKVCLRRKRGADGKMRCASFGIKGEEPVKKAKRKKS